MNSITYAFMAYGLTAVISLVVVGIIVIINSLMSGPSDSVEQEAD